jgi:hypothetical protein
VRETEDWTGADEVYVVLSSAAGTTRSAVVDLNDGQHHDFLLGLASLLPMTGPITVKVYDGAGAPRRLALGGPANEAAAISVELAPGRSLSHEVDLQRAALEPHNGAARLAPGTYRITATYAVTEPGPHWTGSISSAALDVTLP